MGDRHPRLLSPGVMVWARDVAGLSLPQAARALGFKDSKKRSARDRLAALEAGDEQPSHSVLRKMARAYRRSLVHFYLREPPPEGNRGKDFRMVPGEVPPAFNPHLDALIRDVMGRQDIIRDLLEEEAKLLTFVGSASKNESAKEIAEKVIALISFSRIEFRKQDSAGKAFSYLRNRLEDFGVFVFLAGNLGSYHTNLAVDEFRGFAIADRIAPFIVINDRDARSAWSFTALHELTHIFLGDTGMSGPYFTVPGRAFDHTEVLANEVASEILLPATDLAELAQTKGHILDYLAASITDFADSKNISRSMVAYKLYRSDLISKQDWKSLADRFRTEWGQQKQQAEELKTMNPINASVVKRHRLGRRIIALVRRSLDNGELVPTKAAKVLGVNPAKVYSFLGIGT